MRALRSLTQIDIPDNGFPKLTRCCYLFARHARPPVYNTGFAGPEARILGRTAPVKCAGRSARKLS
jgi:hypothetical protein